MDAVGCKKNEKAQVRPVTSLALFTVFAACYNGLRKQQPAVIKLIICCFTRLDFRNSPLPDEMKYQCCQLIFILEQSLQKAMIQHRRRAASIIFSDHGWGTLTGVFQ